MQLLRTKRIVLQGEVADPANPPPGYYFNPRCAYAADECRNSTLPQREIALGHFASCHRAQELTRRGVVSAGA
jgi:peptide/nickel transport system ATP-binding protein